MARLLLERLQKDLEQKVRKLARVVAPYSYLYGVRHILLKIANVLQANSFSPSAASQQKTKSSPFSAKVIHTVSSVENGNSSMNGAAKAVTMRHHFLTPSQEEEEKIATLQASIPTLETADTATVSSWPTASCPKNNTTTLCFSASLTKIEEAVEKVVAPESIKVDKDLIRRLPYSYVKKHLAIPIKETEDEIAVVITDLLQNDLLEELRFLFQKRIRPIWGSEEAVLSIIHANYQHDESSATELLETSRGRLKDKKSEDDENVYDLLEDGHDLAPAIRLLNFIISEAIKHTSSDIHFDPEESQLHVRYRIDGVLQTRMIPPQELQSPLITRLKVMARMDIAERRLPQDGRIKMKLGIKAVDFRVSTLPISTGERVVLRILDKGNITLGLDQIGMPGRVLSEFRKEIASSEGMILVTGPTGSGKTTTLYSALSELKNDEVNIMTIEDPVEYKLSGIAQMGVHPKIGLSFATGLRHILRQDPDIIMIGEIRDKETAEIAIQSSLTGHLVLSTLHTNDAPSAITRLVDMGVEPYLISSCCLGVLAQRLVRKVCSHCNAKREKKASCSTCLGSGFSGRLAIYELMPLTPTIKQQILLSAESTKIKEIARREGMKTLLEHGKELVAQGLTTQEEVWRVTRAGEEEIE